MDKSKKAEELARYSIGAIRQLASEKREMNVETLAGEFLKIENLFRDEKITLSEKDLVKAKQSQAYMELHEKYEKLEAKKNSFFRDYEELSEKRDKEKEFFNKTLLFFSDFAKSGVDSYCKNLLEKFRKAIKKGAGHDILEAELIKFKNNVIKSEMESSQEEEEKKSFLKKFKFAQAMNSGKDKGEAYLELLRETYREIIEKLNLSIDPEGAKGLTELGARLASISSPDDFFMMRSKLLEILNAYLEAVDDDREEAALFIKEIGKRLIEVEDQLLSTYADDSKQVQDSNLSFSTLLEDHLNDLNKNVSISKTLEEVKSAVVSKLNTIKIAIHRKNTEDKQYQEDVESKLHQMQQRFDTMRREMEKAELRTQKMEKDLLLDPLTGAYNRRAYDKRVKEEVERYFRYGTVFSMILFDVDHFKNINDTYGHDIGDKCLFEIIKKVTPLLRQSDFLSRYGGEEFTILLPETGSQGAAKVAEKIRKTVEEISFVYKKDKIRITISLGVGEIHEGDKGYESLFSRLDKAMYEAKNSGRNRVVVGK